MLITLNKTKCKLIGDPHLGRKFEEGVPLHRRGEREREQLEVFCEQLMTPDVDMNVMMGDIFDKFVVSPTVVVQVYEAYAKARMAHPNTVFILLMGNHDISRNTEIRSSFDVLARMLNKFNNVFIMDDRQMYTHPMTKDSFLFMPYEAFETAKQAANTIINAMAEKGINHVEAAFGHWDLQSFGGSDHNLIPTEELSKVTRLAISGHIHTPSDFERDGMRVIGTGSMLPYSHAEDPAGELYVTVTLAELNATIAQSPEAFSNKCVRVLLAPGEALPTEFECRQITTKPVGRDVDQEDVEVKMEVFSFEKILRGQFEANGLSKEDADEAMDIYQEVNNAGD